MPRNCGSVDGKQPSPSAQPPSSVHDCVQKFPGGVESQTSGPARQVASPKTLHGVPIASGPRMSAGGTQIGTVELDNSKFDWDEVERNAFFWPTADQKGELDAYMIGVRKAGNSVGAIIEVTASGFPPGLGAPIYAKLDTDLAASMMSINSFGT